MWKLIAIYYFIFFFFQLLTTTVSVEGEELGFLLGLDIFNTLIFVLSSGIGSVRPIDKLFREEMMNCFKNSSNTRQYRKFCDTGFIIMEMLEQLQGNQPQWKVSNKSFSFGIYKEFSVWIKIFKSVLGII